MVGVAAELEVGVLGVVVGVDVPVVVDGVDAAELLGAVVAVAVVVCELAIGVDVVVDDDVDTAVPCVSRSSLATVSC